MKIISGVHIFALHKQELMKRSLLLTFLIGIPFLLIGQDTGSTEKKYQGLFWKISGNGLDSASYLYGTMHTTDKRAFQFNDQVLPKFKECETYAMELNMEKIDRMELMAGMMMDTTESLKELLGEDHAMVKRYFKDSLNMDLERFDQMQPMFLNSMISKKGLGQDSSVALDMYFHQKAKKQGKQIVGLEKAKEQIDAFGSIPLEKQAELLVKAVQDTSGTENEMDGLINAYVKGDLDTMLAMTKRQQPSENFTEVFLIERNHRMADRSVQYIEKSPTFIAVGAAHLPGEEGVIELLRKKGYTVEPVSE